LSTVTLLSETANAGTAVNDDLSTYANGVGKSGVIVGEYSKAVDGTLAAGAHYLRGGTVPKGAILLEPAIDEVSTAILPATSTNALAVGGVTLLTTGTTLNATGIDALVSSAAMTTSASKIVLTVSGSTVTAGVFRVYLPYIQGTAAN
jgi:hypothetical protein